MDEDDANATIPDHKLCGFFCAVLALTCPQNLEFEEAFNPLRSRTRCCIFRDRSKVGFRTENGAILSSIDAAKCDDRGGKRGQRKKNIGMVRGSVSAVHQLHVLVSHKCLKIVSRVIGDVSGENGEARAVVLVDVHLPVALWSGWQFPKSGSTAAALFRHLRFRHEVLRLKDSAAVAGILQAESRWIFREAEVLMHESI